MSNFPTMTVQEEFEMFVEDALHGKNLHRDDLLHYFCEEYLGIAYCDETMDELVDAVLEEPFVLNGYADMMETEF